jgi:hypothetical protein
MALSMVDNSKENAMKLKRNIERAQEKRSPS